MYALSLCLSVCLCLPLSLSLSLSLSVTHTHKACDFQNLCIAVLHGQMHCLSAIIAFSSFSPCDVGSEGPEGPLHTVQPAERSGELGPGHWKHGQICHGPGRPAGECLGTKWLRKTNEKVKTFFFFHIVSIFNIAKTLFRCMPVYFGVSIIHQTLTWTTWSLMCVRNLFACVYTWEGNLSL